MAKKNNPTGFEYKILPTEKVEKPKPIDEGDLDVDIAKEKNDLEKEQGKLSYGQERSIELKDAHDSPGNLYGSPAPTYLKVTPLNKKGKIAIDYSAKLLGDLDGDNELSSYEQNRQDAIEKNMKKKKS